MDFYPLKLHPCYKEYLWGGERLKRDFGKSDAPKVTAESWELACHRDGKSVVEGGPLNGRTLDDLDRAAYWGTACGTAEFPILVKLIDAAKDLSVQVHPSDRTALARLGEQGKAEMWYIVDCEPKSYLYYGFQKKISREVFQRRVADGTICDFLNKVQVARGDVFYILPGTVHAIGAGILIAEVQQNSNTTFRICDYGRKDTEGNSRPLHLERAVDVISYDPIIPRECRANNVISFPGFTMAEMFACRYFRSYRVDVRKEISLCCDGSSFQHLLCVEGEGSVQVASDVYPFTRGESYFLPASMGQYRIRGSCRVLLSRV